MTDLFLECLDQIARWLDDLDASGALAPDAVEVGRALSTRLRGFLTDIADIADTDAPTAREPGAQAESLPVEWLAELPAQVGSALALELAADGGSFCVTTILLVDDSATILMSMSSILSRSGYQVEQAGNGETALSKLKSGPPPKLIITDFNMPGMNGVDLIRQARKLPALRFIPMLVLTTESQQSKRDEAKAAGATGWLVKPVDPPQLIAVIKQLIPGA